METYAITSEVYYDAFNRCYKNIIVIDKIPKGPLKNLVKQINIPKISPFKTNSSCCYRNNCYYAIYNEENELMNADNYHDLYIYLLNNSYTINSELTNMINKSTFKSSRNLLCFISYKID